MVNPTLQPIQAPDYSELADKITDELINQMLGTEITIPQRQLDTFQQNLDQQLINDTAGDIFIIDAQRNDKEQAVQLIEFKQRILIEQDLIRIENYINEVIQALQQAELQYLTQLSQNPQMVQEIDQTQQNYHRQFLEILTTPIKRNELNLLNQLQTSEIGSYEHFETAMDQAANPILPIDLYLEIERMREENQIRMLYNNGVSEVDMENSIVQESIHIHNKAIFDCLNESLMKFRPYGIQGEPMPWSNKN